MPKANISAIHAAERLYKKGKTYTEISQKIGVTPKTIGEWKKKYGWSCHRQSSSGAPKGNKNAVGNNGGGPIGNQYATTHGGYAKLIFSALTDDEQSYYQGDGESMDEETMLLSDIRLLDIRIARLMQKTKDMQKPGGLYIDSVSTAEEKRKFDTPEDRELYNTMIQAEIDSGERLPGIPYRVYTTTKSADEFILSCQNALNRAQAQKQRCIGLLNKLRIERGGGGKTAPENNLLAAIQDSTKGDMDTDDLPELQQTAELDTDMVE